tara:strand:- start:507 stop:1010 length:504 start_codon:yes stop_codon:yes gene_type:complete
MHYLFKNPDVMLIILSFLLICIISYQLNFKINNLDVQNNNNTNNNIKNNSKINNNNQNLSRHNETIEGFSDKIKYYIHKRKETKQESFKDIKDKRVKKVVMTEKFRDIEDEIDDIKEAGYKIRNSNQEFTKFFRKFHHPKFSRKVKSTYDGLKKFKYFKEEFWNIFN